MKKTILTLTLGATLALANNIKNDDLPNLATSGKTQGHLTTPRIDTALTKVESMQEVLEVTTGEEHMEVDGNKS